MPKLVVRSFTISLDGFSVDNDFMARSDANIGASITGRHMFGPPPDEQDKAAWKGWWGENPPYHHPVFVLIHEKKVPLVMQGNCTWCRCRCSWAKASAFSRAWTVWRTFMSALNSSLRRRCRICASPRSPSRGQAPPSK